MTEVVISKFRSAKFCLQKKFQEIRSYHVVMSYCICVVRQHLSYVSFRNLITRQQHDKIWNAFHFLSSCRISQLTFFHDLRVLRWWMTPAWRNNNGVDVLSPQRLVIEIASTPLNLRTLLCKKMCAKCKSSLFGTTKHYKRLSHNRSADKMAIVRQKDTYCA
jgi:hypothetical protein